MAGPLSGGRPIRLGGIIVPRGGQKTPLPGRRSTSSILEVLVQALEEELRVEGLGQELEISGFIVWVAVF